MGDSEPILSEEVCYTFLILPSPFASWQELYWPNGGDNADPDGDGIANLIEYATGTNPLEITTTNPLTCKMITDDGQQYCVCELSQPISVTDCKCKVIAFTELGSSEETVIEQTSTTATDANWQRLSFKDPQSISSRKQCFYRLKVSLN